MTRLKLLAISFLMLIGLCAHAQTMAVESFELAQTDLTANTPGTMIYDQNGSLCALIKLETTQKGFTFNVGVLGVVKTEEHVGEIWIYVPFGIKKITVQHPQLGTLRDYPIPCSIDKGRTYIMKLTAGNVRTIVEHAVTKQFLYVELNPSDAVLEINGKMKMTEGGSYRELLPFGTYQYKAYRKDYHDLSGQVVISDPENTHSLNINLKAAFGHLTLSSNSTNAGALVYIDDNYVGKIPVTDIKLSSGTHTMRVMREMYEPYNTTFTIADEEKKSMSPSLLADFAEVTLTTSEGAAIYVNDELKGTRTWKGRLATGSYIFESRQKGHLSSRLSYDITRNDQGKTLDVPAPTPIYGSLVLDSAPAKANIYIDGKYIGQTPKYIARQIVGEYKVEAKLDGYKPQTKTVTVSEGQEASLAFTLEKITSPTTATNYSSYSSYTTTQKAAVKTEASKVTASKNKNKNWLHSLELSYGYAPGYKRNYELKYHYREDEYGSLQPVFLTYAFGYKFNNYVSVALGTGLMYHIENIREYDGDWCHQYKRHLLNVPLFCNVKTYLTKSKCQPMLSFSGGVFLPFCNLLVDAGLGCYFKVGRKGNIYLLATISTTPKKEIEYEETEYTLSGISKMGFQWTPSIKLGFCFSN